MVNSFICKVDGCDRDAMYKSQQVCQKHYFRFMRNGHYKLKGFREEGEPRPHKYRYIEKKRGYSSVYEPGHALSNAAGMVKEHRFIYFEQIDNNPTKCALCECPINWEILHIDHIDNNPRNNSPTNLRALCRPCNVYRGHSALSSGKHVFEIQGIRLTSAVWARVPGVPVSHATITRRRKQGLCDYDAVLNDSLTHPNTPDRSVEKKYDRMRGIPTVKVIWVDGHKRIAHKAECREIENG